MELLIALALLSIVLALGYMFLFFGNNSFAIGTRQYNVQNNIRIAADLITEEVRYASYVEVLADSSAIPASIGIYDNYIYVDSATNKMVFLSHNNTRLYPVGQSDSSIAFSRSPSNKILNFTVTGEDDQQTYVINQEVVSLNLDLSPNKIIEGNNTGLALFYQTLDNYLTATLEPELVAFVSNTYTYTITFNKNISSFTLTPPGLPVDTTINGDKLIIVAGSLSNNVEYTLNYELQFPGLVDSYYIHLIAKVKKTGSNYHWSIEK